MSLSENSKITLGIVVTLIGSVGYAVKEVSRIESTIVQETAIRVALEQRIDRISADRIIEKAKADAFMNVMMSINERSIRTETKVDVVMASLRLHKKGE